MQSKWERLAPQIDMQAAMVNASIDLARAEVHAGYTDDVQAQLWLGEARRRVLDLALRIGEDADNGQVADE
ncbi:MAG: hypothetical protein EBR82_68480 [Caulobacteraceae bacterium]|nr:hypothetical protein [Caulobacteraceae bacterium]